MFSSNTQLRVTLPQELHHFLQLKAKKLGLSMSTYVKNLIINDVKDIAYPPFDTNQETEKLFQQALVAEREGSLVEVEHVKDFLKEL